MSILYYCQPTNDELERLSADDRHKRNPLTDIKHGLDLIFELKEKIDRLHPVATETLVRFLAY